ncbi:MAG: hypothetical protein P1U40_02215 [Coxiellaceae bacterium]|nr:hypothetical protein [Coxiellaceae bacterium]
MRLVQDSVNQLLNLTANTNPLVGLSLYTAAIGLLFYGLDKKYNLYELLTEEHVIDTGGDRQIEGFHWSAGRRVSPWDAVARRRKVRQRRFPGYDLFLEDRVCYERNALPGIAEERSIQPVAVLS